MTKLRFDRRRYYRAWDRLPGDARVVALERSGTALASREWSGWLEQRRLDARDLCFLIGGPEGLPDEALDAADERISLGPPAR